MHAYAFCEFVLCILLCMCCVYVCFKRSVCVIVCLVPHYQALNLLRIHDRSTQNTYIAHMHSMCMSIDCVCILSFAKETYNSFAKETYNRHAQNTYSRHTQSIDIHRADRHARIPIDMHMSIISIRRRDSL